ncbi:unnamed protein product, partial [Aphanomyces euteiches]
GNFVTEDHQDDGGDDFIDDEAEVDESLDTNDAINATIPDDSARAWRDDIASTMWNDYLSNH